MARLGSFYAVGNPSHHHGSICIHVFTGGRLFRLGPLHGRLLLKGQDDDDNDGGLDFAQMVLLDRKTQKCSLCVVVDVSGEMLKVCVHACGSSLFFFLLLGFCLLAGEDSRAGRQPTHDGAMKRPPLLLSRTLPLWATRP